ncbi:hypothetical protein N476_14755 [Pseudoalteromonas luteoviolacea H33]|uniref:Uncharacterized protein n=2 Tax=Pseudoalteromonas luteoviolacea TaxID=43657 RepID=A0A167EKU0_9GAMM|nr:hypothetical protein N476_14755 [Pseudoalteromonas luteoviolacea H33]KZN74973.1 hypothetical protein N477_20395 [Pseudoalteromonas luteoviolacea H33-S]
MSGFSIFYYPIVMTIFKISFSEFMNIKNTMLAVGATFVSTGCEVTYKQEDADRDFNKAVRFLKQNKAPKGVDNLLSNVLEFCNETKKPKCLVYTHLYYGDFYFSSMLTNHKGTFNVFGFAEAGVSYENRHQQGITHYLKAISFVDPDNNQAFIASLYERLSLGYRTMGEQEKECEALQKALMSQAKAYPDGDEPVEHFPVNVKYFSEYIAFKQKRAGCTQFEIK